ncbi:MAG: helix-turn-helix domain-containing protein [Candidatus Omnitrophota bacterium]|nr:hypothetical protein [Candidatus Omnitrophota bacterium]
MITIMLTGMDESRVKDMLEKIFEQEGYDLSEGLNQGNVIRLAQKGRIHDLAFIKDKVIELDDDLFKDKEGVLYREVLEAIERPLLEQVLEKTQGNQLKAARILGINRNTMRCKVKRLGINAAKWKI